MRCKRNPNQDKICNIFLDGLPLGSNASQAEIRCLFGPEIGPKTWSAKFAIVMSRLIIATLLTDRPLISQMEGWLSPV